jgi:hypothetical protein
VITDESNGEDASGSYEIFFYNSGETAMLASLNFIGEVSGTLGTGELRAYEFEGEAGRVINLQLHDMAGNDFEPQIVIYLPDGTYVTSDWDPNTASISDYTLPQSGTYTLVISDNDNGTDPADFRLVADVDGFGDCPPYICGGKGSWKYKLYQE